MGKDLLDASNMQHVIAKMPALSFYFAIKELGIDDAVAIFKAGDQDQIQTCFDLDCWQGQSFEPEEALAWLAPMAQYPDHGLAETFFTLHEELQVLILQRYLTVYDTREDGQQAPDTSDPSHRMETPDNYFIVDATPPESGEAWPLEPLLLLKRLYAFDLEATFQLLTAIRWELPLVLEEQAYRFREARVGELGFPPVDEAHSLFALPKRPLPKATAVYVEANQQDAATSSDTPYTPKNEQYLVVPKPYAMAFAADAFFFRAWRQLPDPHRREELQEELIGLCNTALIALDTKPGQLLEAQNVARTVVDTLSLALEHESQTPSTGSDAILRAQELLSRCALRDLFRHGHHLVRPLGAQAKALASSPKGQALLSVAQSDEEDYGLDRQICELLRALQAKHPMEAGFDPVRPARKRAIGTWSQHQKIQSQLDGLKNRFGIDISPPKPSAQ